MADEKKDRIIETRDKQEYYVTAKHKHPHIKKPGTYTAHPNVVAKMVKNGWADEGKLIEFPRTPTEKKEEN